MTTISMPPGTGPNSGTSVLAISTFTLPTADYSLFALLSVVTTVVLSSKFAVFRQLGALNSLFCLFIPVFLPQSGEPETQRI
jgi:hypothetical protein